MSIKKESIIDLIVLINVVVTLSFSDYGSLCIFIQLFSFLSLLLLNWKEKIKITSFNLIFLKIPFVLLCFFSFLWAVNKSNVLFWSLGIALYFVNTGVIAFYIISEKRWNKFIYFLLFAGTVLCLRMLIEVPHYAWGKERVGNYLSHDPGSGYGNTGITFVLGMISTIVISSDDVFKKKLTKWIFGFMFVAFSLLSGSKKQIFLLIITFIMYAFLKSENQKKLIKNIFLLIFSSIILYFVVMKIEFFYNVIGVRLETFFNFFSDNQNTVDSSTISRSKYIPLAINIFIQHPFNGVGIDCFKFVNPYTIAWAENNYVEILADLGIFGFIIYYIPHCNMLRDIFKRIKNKNRIDIVIYIALICLLFIDFSMVSYHNSILQFFLSFVFVSNFLIKNKKEGLKL